MQVSLGRVQIEEQEFVFVSYPWQAPSVLDGLSAAERAVLELWTEGRSMRAIARGRGVTPRTIANQIASSYRKLGVRSRSQLLRLLGPLRASA